MGFCLRAVHQRAVRRAVRFVAVAVLIASAASLGVGSVAGSATTGLTWQTTWTSPTDLADGYASDVTVRDIARVATAGTAITITLSNLWSDTPTTFNAVSVGAQASGIDVVPGTIVPVLFGNGSRSVTVAAHSRVTSDATALRVHEGENIAVSVFVAGFATASVHFCCYDRIDSYATADGAGNLTDSPTGAGFDPTLTSPNMRWLSAVAVENSSAQGTVVAFGDSITDGFGVLNNGYSWVDAVQARIWRLAPERQMSVVNEGIAGNTLTVFPPNATYEDISGGLPGIVRLGPDALSLPGVKDVVLFLGTNDIWFGAGGKTGHPIPPYGSAAALESTMRQIITVTHAHGVKIFGVTLLPRSSSKSSGGERAELWDPQEQAVLNAVNQWILSPASGFNGVFNLAAIMGDVYNGACQPNVPFPPYFNTDNLHPDIAGQTAMANAMSTTYFGLPQAPQLPPVVVATPTPGCPGAVAASNVLAQGRQSPTTTTSTSTSTTSTTTTTTTPVTTTTRAVHRGSGLTHREVVGSAIALLLLVVLGLATARRRMIRRRVLRRDAARRSAGYGYGPPPRPGPPPRRG